MDNLSATNNVAANSINAYNANQVTINDNLVITGDLTVNGNSVFSMSNPYWVAAIIDYTGGSPYLKASYGRYTPTNIARASGQATGVFQFNFPEHPYGTNYLCTGNGTACYVTFFTSVRTSTRMGFVTRDSVNLALADRETHVVILA